MQTVALIDYGSGNLHSAHKALVRAGADRGLDLRVLKTADPETIVRADRIVLPGVGAFGACARALAERDGVIEALTETVRVGDTPFLGICVGMQLLATTGAEYGPHEGLNFIPGEVVPIEPGPGAKIPHMGWNEVHGEYDAVIPPRGDAYFVHSYRYRPDAPSDIAGLVRYGETFPAAIVRDNMVGVQFHPEKSQAYGLTLLGNFLTWSPK